MPQTLAQIMGMLVTAIVVLGTDLDVLYAVPLGILAGAITTYIAALAPAAKSAKSDPERRRDMATPSPVDPSN